ncbi:MAG: zf-HC2 domain-containing protein [Ignavibacteriae bacterium]|nr:zf-HC2 domain-containing protein [Ignavibacteriota bacterium]
MNKAIKNFVWLMLPPCKEVTELISLNRDRGISFAERLKVRAHILFCKFCARYLRQMQSLEEELHHKHLPEDAPPDVIKRIKKIVRDNS